MSIDPIRFAVVGCGLQARKRHVPNIARSEKTDLTVCCDLSDDALEECRAVHGAKRTTRDFREAVADPDVQAVLLATTEKLRLPVIEAAAAAGKAVYVEKPLARDLKEMAAIREVVHNAGVPFCVGHNRRRSPAMVEARRIFRAHIENPTPCPWRIERMGDARPDLSEDGAAGMSVRVNDDWHEWCPWVFDPEQAPHGQMLFEMSHFTDMCNWFLQAEPEEVVALESPRRLNHGVVIRYRTGEIATIMMADNGTIGYPKELYEIFGGGAAVVIDRMLEIRTAGIEGVEPIITFPILNDRYPDIGTEGGLSGWLKKKRAACEDAVRRGGGDDELVYGEFPDVGHFGAIEAFADEVAGRGRVVCGVDEAILATRMCFAAIRAAEERRAVRIEEIEPG